MSLALGHVQWGSQAGSRLEASAIYRSATSDLFRAIALPISKSTQSSRALSATSRLNAVADRIEGLSKTPQDWDSYGTAPPSAGSIAKAVNLLNFWQAVDLEPELVLPSAEGGVSLDVAGQGGRRALVELLNDGTAQIVLYDDASYCETLFLADTPSQVRTSFETMSSYIRRGSTRGGHS